jgi:death on curing protein
VTFYLTPLEVMVMHRVLIQRYGGADGLRDAGALEAALYRPQSGYYDDLIAEAAALFESLAINHPFIDGNKRVAFACVDVFLRTNGYRITAKPAAIFRWMSARLEGGNFNMEHIEPWLRKQVKKARE